MRNSHRVTLGLLALVACAKPDPPPPPAAAAGPDIQTREIEYQVGATKLKGFLAWDASKTDRRPGVVVVHEWWGHNQHARDQARRLAEGGYVGMALDMYGDGRVTNHPDTAQAFVAAASKDPAGQNARFLAAIAQLKLDAHVDSTRIAAIGYCFGGYVVLSQARAGADLGAVASFHGALPSGKIDSGTVRARILVLTGAADPMVPATEVDRFSAEMTAAGARFEVISYPGAQHSFTNPDADSHGMAGLRYDAATDRQSWAAMMKLFAEVFGR
ncbi:MAG: dienelactone hydrolase family protein [Gemmatimonadales bacterium]